MGAPGAGFEELVAEAAGADVSGWDFSWLDGRASEQRPPWSYARLMGEHVAAARAWLDVQTGGGEVASSVPVVPPVAVATESWPPNTAAATARLHPRGIVVVDDPDEPPLPFADGAFDLVTSRHPATIWWGEVARVLAPGGTYLGQHVGPASAFELVERFTGPQSEAARRGRHPDDEAAAARAADLDVVDVQTARLRMEIADVGAAVYLLRKVVWWVPDFTVARYEPELRALHEQIQRHGPFVAHSTRHLIRARRR